MAISASNIAFRYLGFEFHHRVSGSGKEGDVSQLLPAHMVKVEDANIAFSTINAWMSVEVLADAFLHALPLLLLISVDASTMRHIRGRPWL